MPLASGSFRLSRFSLRYQAIDVSLAGRDIVAGRAADCDLVLDDTLVSRRHAVFRHRDEAVEVEDLGSRNGVLVNDKRIDGRARLEHGDRVQIGSQVLTVKDGERARSLPGTAELSRCGACGQFVPADDELCRNCGAPLGIGMRTSGVPPTAAGVASLRPHGSFAVLAQVAEKAMGMGRFEEAERVLGAPLTQLLGSIQSRSETPPKDNSRDFLATAARYAVRLAEARGTSPWLDYAFDLFNAARQLMPAELIDELYRVTVLVHYTNPRPVRGYLATLKETASDLGPSERFLVQRLEGLERRIGSA
jgi:hypothetical protein